MPFGPGEFSHSKFSFMPCEVRRGFKLGSHTGNVSQECAGGGSVMRTVQCVPGENERGKKEHNVFLVWKTSITFRASRLNLYDAL